MSAPLEQLIGPARRTEALRGDEHQRALDHYTAQARAANRHLAGESYEQITRVHRYETVICTACNGSGEDAHQVLRCCRFCGGSGETEVEILP